MYIYDKLSNKVYPINKEIIYIGRSKDCDIILNDLEVSRRHAKIYKDNEGFCIEDLSSKNGIFINNTLISSPVPIKEGDRIEIVRYSFDLLSRPPVMENSKVDTKTDLITISLKNRLEYLINRRMEENDIDSLRREVMEIINKLNTLYDFISIINSSWELEDILENLLHRSMELLEAERGAILINKYPENILLPIISHKIEREIQSKNTFSLSRVIIEKVQKEKKTILIDDAMLDESISSDSVIASRIRSVIASPIMFNDQVLGIIYLDHREQSGVFDDKDISFFNSIVIIASIAINNSNIYTKTLKQKDQYYKDKVYKNFELYKNKLLVHLKEALKTPIETVEGIKELDSVIQHNDLITILNRLQFDINNVISELISTELPSIDAPVFDSMDINLIALVSEIYKNIFPYAYLKDIKVFFTRPSNKELYITGDYAYIKDIASEILFNIIDILEESSEISIRIDENKCMLAIDYDFGPIFLEERSIEEFLDEKVRLDIQSYEKILKNKISFTRQRDRKGKILICFSKQMEHIDEEDTFNLIYKFQPKSHVQIGKAQKKVLVFNKKDSEYFKLISDYIRLIGFETLQAITMEDALSSMEEHNPNIVLLDYSLIEDNFKNCTIINELKEKKKIPIILLSSTKNISRDIFSAGIDDIMFIPFKLEELELRIYHSFESSSLKKHALEIEKIETVKAMIASISHELNNPLTTASINTELIKMSDPKNSEYADRIMTSLDKMKDIVQKLSNLKKVSFKDYLKDQKMLNLNPDPEE